MWGDKNKTKNPNKTQLKRKRKFVIKTVILCGNSGSVKSLFNSNVFLVLLAAPLTVFTVYHLPQSHPFQSIPTL